MQERAIEIGLTTQDAMNKKKKRFMVLFFIVMLAALLLILGFWNNVTDFKTVYLDSLFLEVMNWYDGL